jgi:hypothetical protein
VLWDEELDEPFRWINGQTVDIDILKHAEFYDYEIDLTTPDTDINPKGITDGRWILQLAGQGYALWQENGDEIVDTPEGANLDTPALDMSNATGVFLEFDSEVVVGNDSSRYEVYVSTDGGENFDQLFTYHGALMDYEEAPYFMRHYLPAPQAAGESSVIFRFHAEGQDPGFNETGFMAGFWAIDNVRVTRNTGTPVQDWELM